jgi:hypothetical protein
MLKTESRGAAVALLIHSQFRLPAYPCPTAFSIAEDRHLAVTAYDPIDASRRPRAPNTVNSSERKRGAPTACIEALAYRAYIGDG